jgi:galactokinase
VRRIVLNFGGSLRGADIVFASDLPPASGVSSSSALVVAIFLALSSVNDLSSREAYRESIRTPQDLAGYLGAVENGLDFKSLTGNIGVGTFGGSEDHTAILCAAPNALVQYSFSPVTFERGLPLPATLTFVIGASGILAEKSGAALELYNRVSRRLRVCLEQWNRATGRDDVSMGAAIRSSPDASEQIRSVLERVTDAAFSSTSLVKRFEQFNLETARVIPAAGDALARGDLPGFGELVDQSQRAAEWGLENQIDETLALVASARKLGAVAASAFGAGFGGSVWALVDSSTADDFLGKWSAGYAAAFPAAAKRATFFTTLAGPPAIPL